MSTIQTLWQSIETQYNNGTFPVDQLKKIDALVFSDDIENIRNGLTLMTTIAPEYLCRYLQLDGESVVLRAAGKFAAPLSAERVLVESAKGESMWQDLYESGAFESMEFRALGDVAIENLSESEKEFCVRMSKEMVRVPAGEFMMGALENDGDAHKRERPRHQVTLTRDFLMGKYAVTQAFWESVMGSNPSLVRGANRPVEWVSWFDCVLFCNKLSEQEGLTPAYDGLGDYQVGDDLDMDENEIESLSAGITCNWDSKGYRLPTEAEWEYSARANQSFKYAGSDNVDEVAWYWDNCDTGNGTQTHPVGQKKPNGFGLYDMSGNVFEWCWDIFVDYSSGPQTDPTGPDHGLHRVVRGGCWFDDVGDTRVSRRDRSDPTLHGRDLGFRLSRLTP